MKENQNEQPFLDEIPEPEESVDGEVELTVEERLAEAERERDEYKDRFLRALADSENARKRADKSRREAEQYGGSRLARDLLPVYDNLKRALDAAQDAKEDNDAPASALVEGVELTMREIISTFKKYGIERISPEVGDRFDPNQHEAMFEAPVPGTHAGDIIEVSAEGFMMYDRLLRAAHVGVSSMPATATK